MRSVTRILFSLSISSGGFETDRIHEFVKIVNNALVKAVELRALLLLQFAVAGDGRQQPGGQGGVDSFEQLEEDEADGIAFAQQAVAPGTRNSLHSPLARSLERS